VSLPRFGGYRAEEALGEGALATVYKAVHEPLGRVVAIKALKPSVGSTSPFAAHVEREARVLAELNHTNIVSLFDFVKTEQSMYLVLEYVDGFSLSAVVKKQEARKLRFSATATAAICAQIARGLAHMHERGILHRDLKPSNVLVSKRGEAKLCDFGIAHRERLPSADIPLTKESNPPPSDNAGFGTPAYMSPEQILGEDVDGRSDLFSLGVVLYQMLTGVRPFDGPTDKDKRAASQRTRRDPPPKVRSRAPDVPRALEKITERLLEKLPDDRYRTAAEVADALCEIVQASTREELPVVVARALGDAGLVPAKRGTASLPPLALRTRDDLRATVIGLGGIGLLFVVLAGTLQATTRRTSKGADVTMAPLAFGVEKMGGLRVVAAPWAEVRVDGQHMETTPFAHALPLSVGKHWVTLTHPNAPDERREISVLPGETVRLEVVMRLDGPDGGGP
jgi:serine/threonine-protein kinase